VTKHGVFAVASPPTQAPVHHQSRLTDAEQRRIHEVLVGDVWLFGRTSNMEFGLAQPEMDPINQAAEQIPKYVLFMVNQQFAYSRWRFRKVAWKICSPQTIALTAGGGFLLRVWAYFFVDAGATDIMCRSGWLGGGGGLWVGAHLANRGRVAKHPVPQGFRRPAPCRGARLEARAARIWHFIAH